MKENEDIWLNEVLDSTKGMQRAKPSEALFDKILSEINTKEAKIIRLPQLKIAIAAAVAIAVVNIVALSQYTTTADSQSTTYTNTLVSDYNIYD